MIFLLFFGTFDFLGVQSLNPMKIAVVSGYGTLEPDMQNELQNSLTWFQSAFLVKKSPHLVTLDDVMQRIPEYQKFSSVVVQTLMYRRNLKFQQLSSLFEVADFTVFIVAQDPMRCRMDKNLLAEAMPIALVSDSRPQMAKMSLCLENKPPRNTDSRFFFDLFRHEILHALGYGMIIDKSERTVKPMEKYTWNDINMKGYLEEKHFLDFDEFALKPAKSHFGCHGMRGIEADGERKNHLNEYIFGNELMTTHLEPTGNVFSWISVGIIERTFNGKDQWYFVNRTFVAPEANSYSYGKDFGCVFLEGSCHDFIKFNQKTRPNFSIAPFCSSNLRETCFRLPGNVQLHKLSDNNCESRQLIGDNKRTHRRCPFINGLPMNAKVVQCPPPPGG